MPKSDTVVSETGGRRFGQGPDTRRVAIGETHYRLPQTLWLNISVDNGPGEPSLTAGSWHRSYEKYGIEVGRFIKLYACPQFLRALRKELQDG